MVYHQPIKIVCPYQRETGAIESVVLEYWQDRHSVVYRAFDGCDNARGGSACKRCIESINRRILVSGLSQTVDFEGNVVVDQP